MNTPALLGENLIAEVLSGRRDLRVEVYDLRGNPLGYLAPVTEHSLADQDLIHKLTRWRNHAKEYFFTQITLTCQQTEEWLRIKLLKDHRRLLFVIYAGTTPIGTVGFLLLPGRSAELGNLVRGESGGGFAIMQRSHQALLEWLFVTLEIETAIALVFEDNKIAVNHLRAIGFQSRDQLPLSRQDGVGTVRYEPGSDPTQLPNLRNALRMELSRTEWLDSATKPGTPRPSWYSQLPENASQHGPDR